MKIAGPLNVAMNARKAVFKLLGAVRMFLLFLSPAIKCRNLMGLVEATTSGQALI
jgi:hypothetical protein